jgi:hypothetical protein
MAGFKTVAHRLYLTAFWLLLVGGVLIAVSTTVVCLHDEHVVRSALACLRTLKAATRMRELTPAEVQSLGLTETAIAALPMEGADLPAKCGIETNKYLGPRVNAAWGYEGLQDSRTSIAALSWLALVPWLLVVLLRKWLVWLTRAETSDT